MSAGTTVADVFGVIIDGGGLICSSCAVAGCETGEMVTSDGYPDGFTCADCGDEVTR
jgi:hypothetical protein